MNAHVTKHLLEKAEIWNDNRFNNHSTWGADTDRFLIDLNSLTEKEMDSLGKVAKDSYDHRALIRKMRVAKRMQKTPSAMKTGRIEKLEPILKALISKLPNKWIFREVEDGLMIPYYVEDINYHPTKYASWGVTPAHVDIKLRSIKRRELQSETIRYWEKDLNREKPVLDLLQDKKLALENGELVQEYTKEMAVFVSLKDQVGKQFKASGHGTIQVENNNHWWRNNEKLISLDLDGRASKVVMDDRKEEYERNEEEDDRDDDRENVTESYWKRHSDDDRNPVVPPIHPYVLCFDLNKHQHVEIHATNLEPYQYDKTCGAKLILPATKKDLVNILVSGASRLMEDIVEGKTGGIIVLATGEPGTGKTLTAEIYAETLQKALYMVQCSQLGVNPDDIEKNLARVLLRAQRWGAILLIDEADVYTRERGADINQNAIVGVFLRILEYYRGILFMTSNRATIIDDAIISRATAHIVYEIPNLAEAAKLWEVLSTQFKVKLKGTYKEYAKKFPDISGRTIKNLLKLSILISEKEKKPITLELVEYASQFIDGVAKEKK